MPCVDSLNGIQGNIGVSRVDDHQCTQVQIFACTKLRAVGPCCASLVQPLCSFYFTFCIATARTISAPLNRGTKPSKIPGGIELTKGFHNLSVGLSLHLCRCNPTMAKQQLAPSAPNSFLASVPAVCRNWLGLHLFRSFHGPISAFFAFCANGKAFSPDRSAVVAL